MSQLPVTRQSLLIRLRESSGEAWSEFLEIYEQAIYRFARYRGLQDADAWDVTQEVLSAVESKIESWQFDKLKGSFRGWLFRVARNIAADKIVEQTRRAAAGGDSRVAELLAELPETSEQQSTAFWTEYRRTLMNWAAKQIQDDVKETSWQSFVRSAIEGQTAETVAADLGISVGSVYAAKFRIVARIRKLVARFDDTEDEDLPLQSIESNGSANDP